MASAFACARAPAEPSSGAGGPRAAGVSRRSGRPFASLRKGSDIGKVRRTGSRRRVGGVLVFTAAGMADGPRVAIVASRRVGSAVRRNRAKRRLREALSQVPLRNDREYVVVADSAVAEVPFEGLVAWVRAATQE